MKWFIERESLADEQKMILDEVINSNQNFLIEGPAGSGKTLLAVHIVKDFLSNKPDAKVLVVTFTKSVARLIEQSLADDNIEVEATWILNNSTHYDLIVVDEVQDINIRIENLDNHKLHGTKFIFLGDYYQLLGRSHQNYKYLTNRYALCKLSLTTTFRFDEGLAKFISSFSNDSYCSNIIGETKPSLTKYKSSNDETNGIIKASLNKMSNVNSVLIMFEEHKQIELFFDSLLKLFNLNISIQKLITITRSEGETKRNYTLLNNFLEENNIPFQYYGQNFGETSFFLNAKKATVMTVASAKGLHADCVFLPYLSNRTDTIPTNRKGKREFHRFYIAISRTQKELFLSYHEDNINDLLNRSALQNINDYLILIN